MPTSFLPDAIDTPKTLLQENQEYSSNQIMESIPEPAMPLDELEGHPEANEHFLEEGTEASETQAPTPAAVAQSHVDPPSIPQLKDSLSLQIEKIMEEDLGDVYSAVTPVQKQEFKIKGEQTAHKIKEIIKSTSAKLGKIIKLIFEWLKILPGVNHFFLEQEAKIKAEKIIALSHQDKNLL